MLAEAVAGREIVIAKAGKPMVRLVPFKKNEIRKTLGMLKGKIRMSDDFDAPLPPDLRRRFSIE